MHFHYSFFGLSSPDPYYALAKGLREGDKNGVVVTILNPYGSGEWNDVKDFMKNEKAKKAIDMIAPDPYPGVWETPDPGGKKGIENICNDINNPSHPFYSKLGGIMETGCCALNPLGYHDKVQWIKDKIPEMIEAIKECNENNRYKIEIFCYYSLFTGDDSFGLIDKTTLKKLDAYYALEKILFSNLWNTNSQIP